MFVFRGRVSVSEAMQWTHVIDDREPVLTVHVDLVKHNAKIIVIESI